MSNRRFERSAARMFHYRQALVRMRQGDSDRDIARCGLMGRKKAAALRQLAEGRGWLDPARALPEDIELATSFTRREAVPASCVSSLEPYRDRVVQWYEAGIQGTTIHSALVRQHGFTGSYSAVRRFLQQLAAERPPAATCRLAFAPGEAAQVDRAADRFGAGPLLTDVHTGELIKTWVFVMTLCWSRHQYAEVVRDQSSATWLACHRRAFAWFNGVPARLIIDNAKCAITRACTRDPEVQRFWRRVRRRVWLQDRPRGGPSLSAARSAEEGYRRGRCEVPQARASAAARVPRSCRCQPPT